MADVLKILKAERDTLKKRLKGLESAIVSLAGGAKKAVKRAKKTMSKAARKKIGEAQKKRWAEIRKKEKE